MRQRNLRPDAWTCGAVASTCERSCQWELALQIFAEMQMSRIQLDTAAYNVAIIACSRGQKWQGALWLWRQLRLAGLLSDLITFNALVAAVAGGERWDLALQLLDCMQDSKIAPDHATYHAVGLSRNLPWECAVGILQEMCSRRLGKTILAFGAALSCCHHNVSGYG